LKSSNHKLSQAEKDNEEKFLGEIATLNKKVFVCFIFNNSKKKKKNRLNLLQQKMILLKRKRKMK